MKRIILDGAAVVLLAIASAAGAQPSATPNVNNWPQRPVRIVVGFPPGGGIDVVARLLSVKLADSLGQQFVVDNRPGANGMLGTDIVAKAPPDGHTFFIGTTGNLSVNPMLVKNLPFNMERDFTPVIQTSSVPFLIYTHPKVPAKSLDELIAHIKANPGKINYYSAGSGSLPHLASELLNSLAGIKAIHVPYKGSAPGFNDLLGGQVQFGFDAVPIGLQHIKAGRMRAVATTNPKRLTFLPDVAAANETLKGFEVVNWYGIVAPTGTPARIIDRLHSEIVKALNIAELREKLIAQGLDPVDSNPKTFGAFMKAESAKWARVIQDANIRAD
jgi:tripartite-type tricarboxylate transporter receptor subunit TctC